MEFEWDEDKAKTNFAKHRIDFYDVTSVFEGDYVLLDGGYGDDGEERFVAVGYPTSGPLILLNVVFTERGTRLRLISARKATRHEQRTYYSRYS
ncbi:MAG: BrnT family toxin [Pseudomonadota bacterium]